MANQVETLSFGGPEKQILIAEDSYKVTLGVVVTNTGIDADANGKKIIKAGTPLTGSFEARNTAFVVEDDDTVNCIALHDVDVTAGATNATVVIAGVVDLNKLDEATQALITSTIKGALPRIIFFK